MMSTNVIFHHPKQKRREVQMAFDPSNLRRATQQKSRNVPTKRAKKRARERTPDQTRRAPGETSIERCNLVLELFWRYRGEGMLEGARAVETFTLKALSIARAMTLKGDDNSRRLAELDNEVEQREKRIEELEADRSLLERKNNELQAALRKAREEVGLAKDETEDVKLELERKTKEFEAMIEDARTKSVEDFKKSEEFGNMRGEYDMGSYNYAFKQARAYLRSKFPNVSADNLVVDPEVLDNLELSSPRAP